MDRNTIIINGVAIEVEGNNVSVRAGTVYVDNQPVQSGLSGSVSIHWFGELANLETNGPATVHGTVHGNVTANGRVRCDDVKGSVAANGRVRCDDLKGSARTNGAVYGGSRINGNIHANGRVDIR